jgi:uncharacterized lipoprotein YbaY
MNWSREVIVDGEIRLSDDAGAFHNATVRVTLADVTRADAPSRTVAEETIRNVSHGGGPGGVVPFRLQLESPDPRTRYAVRAHVDVNGDGHVSRGDYISMESYPVLTFDAPSRVSIRVRPVESRGIQ